MERGAPGSAPSARGDEEGILPFMNRTRTATWSDPAPGRRTALSLTGLEYMRGIADGELPAPPLASVAPTMVLHINYIRPITISTGRIRCLGQVVHLGKRSATADGRLVDMNGKLYAHATGTFVISELEELPSR